MPSSNVTEKNRLTCILIGGLRALQIMQDRSEVETGPMRELTRDGFYPPPSDTELNALICALNDGRVRLVAGVSNVVAFKRTEREAS